MDLRNNTITVGELLDHPAARDIFRRRFGQWANHPMVQRSRTMTLAELVRMAGTILPRRTIEETLAELKRL